MVHVCETCSGTNFHTVDGYFYCLECGTQSHNQQVEMESEAIMIGDRTIGGDVVTLKKDKPVEARLTSWEEYNYILVGLTDELLNLGANYRLKKVVLKLWTRYLQMIEAAFFSLHDECLPKLPVNYLKRDAEILYNKHHRKRRKERKRRASFSSIETAETAESKTSTGKADSVIKSFNISKFLKKTKEELARAQYEDYKKFEDDSSSVATSLATGSQQSSDEKSSNVSLNLKFTRNARRVLKRTIPKKHIQKHESDYEDALDCHQERINPKEADKMETLSNSVLIAILYLALNLTEDEIQWSDLIRFLREGHLSYYNIQHFLPENVKQEGSSNFEFLVKKSIFYHASMRQIAAKLCRDMAITELVRPNLLQLINRYVDDLRLPIEMKVLLEKFVNYCPPEMEYNAENRLQLRLIPNFEGRAMSYVLFLLKLLFGLDDERESMISDCARDFNKLIPDHPELHLFVVEDWLRMLRVRRIVIEKFHMPTAVRRPWEDSGDNSQGLESNAQRYTEHIKHMYESKIPTERLKRPASDAFAVANNTFQLLAGLNERNQSQRGDSEERMAVDKSYNFNATLTPLRDYTKVLLEEHSKMNPLMSKSTEECLREDFTFNSVQVFYGDRTSTDKLKDTLLETKSMNLGIKELGLSTRKLEVVEANRHDRNTVSSSCKIQVEFVPQEVTKKLIKGFKRIRVNLPKTVENEENELNKSNSDHNSSQSKMETADILLYTSNMDYWVQFSSYRDPSKPFPPEAYAELIESIPNNFKFLVFEMARTIEQDPRYLFLELAVLERMLVCGVDERNDTKKRSKNVADGPKFSKSLW